jgi:hypothetical protein
MKIKNIGLDVNLRAGLLQGSLQRFKIGLPPLDQANLMAISQGHAVAHGQSIQVNSATSGRWSDMRCQMRPVGAMA